MNFGGVLMAANESLGAATEVPNNACDLAGCVVHNPVPSSEGFLKRAAARRELRLAGGRALRRQGLRMLWVGLL